METQVMSKPSKQVKAKIAAEQSVAGSAPSELVVAANAAEEQAKAENDAKIQAQRDAAAKLEAEIAAEIEALEVAERAMLAAAGKIGSLGLERLAVALGESTS